MAKKENEDDKDHKEAGGKKKTRKIVETTTEDITHEHAKHGSSDLNPKLYVAGAVAVALFFVGYVYPRLHLPNDHAGLFPTTCSGSYPSVPLTSKPEMLPQGCNIGFKILEGSVEFTDTQNKKTVISAGNERPVYDAIQVRATTQTAVMTIIFTR